MEHLFRLDYKLIILLSDKNICIMANRKLFIKYFDMIAMCVILVIFIIMQNYLYADYESCSNENTTHTTALHDLFNMPIIFIF